MAGVVLLVMRAFFRWDQRRMPFLVFADGVVQARQYPADALLRLPRAPQLAQLLGICRLRSQRSESSPTSSSRSFELLHKGFANYLTAVLADAVGYPTPHAVSVSESLLAWL